MRRPFVSALTSIGFVVAAAAAVAQTPPPPVDAGEVAANGGKPSVVVIRLKHTEAASAAKVLEEVFGGPQQGKGPGRVRIVPDPRTNSLLVQASAQDMVTIQNLLKHIGDVPEAEAPARRPFFIPLEHAQAEATAAVLEQLYPDEIGGRGNNQPANPRVLILAADRRTNTILLRCPEPLFREIQEVVSQLDVPVGEE